MHFFFWWSTWKPVSYTHLTLDNYIKEKEGILYNSKLSLEEKEKRIDILLEKYGDLPTGESRNEIQSMILINEIIKSNKKWSS